MMSAAGSGPVLQHTWRTVRLHCSVRCARALEASLTAWIMQLDLPRWLKPQQQIVILGNILCQLRDGHLLSLFVEQVCGQRVTGIQPNARTSEARQTNLSKCAFALCEPDLVICMRERAHKQS